MNFRFFTGQCVEYVPIGGVAGRYSIVRAMPLEPIQVEPKYRIKGELAGEERVVSECSLSENVGTPDQYELIAQSREAQRMRKKAFAAA